MTERRRVRTTDGLTLAVRVSGAPDAPILLCVHGYPDNQTLWEPVRALLEDDFRVVSYDVRGAGESDVPASRDGYRLDQLGTDLATVADEVSPERPVHLLAHDWGSIQAWHAVTEPALDGRFATFTSISGPCLDHVAHWSRTPWRQPLSKLNQTLHSAYIGYFHVPYLAEASYRSGLGMKLMAKLRGGDEPVLADAVNGLDLYRANIREHLSAPGERRTPIPVQILAPQQDSFVGTPMQRAAEPFAPRLVVRQVAGRHWLPVARPETVARAVRQFARNPRTGGRFAGKLVVITGFGNGIGKATAKAFAAEGATVVGCDRDAEWAEATAAELGEDARGYQVDVSDGDAMAGFAKQVRAEHGVPDIVVNNAGIGLGGPFLATTVADWERVLGVNLWGVIHGCREFAQQMVERGDGGQIVNIASAAAYTPTRELPAYATSKSAVLMLSECLRAELAEHHIGVTAICPGIVNSNITSTTTFAGADDEAQRVKREQAVQAYARRNYSTDRTARAILAAAEKNTAVAPVTPEAHVLRAVSRYAPALSRLAAKLKLGS
jgi:NAD(P)-dependent dehydrogenase (short-subunit alcohol dehydrogenase family)/pimeloyl-ACP methyl ester carboxylesterase